METLQQRGGRLVQRQRLDGGASGLQRVKRQIDPIEVLVVLAAILQVIVDLQRRAERVGGGPGRGALAVNVEHEPPDRHGRIAAIVNELVPVRVAKLADVHPEGGQQVERMARRHRTFRQRPPQIDGFRLAVALAEQLSLEQIEVSELGFRIQRRMIGDVVRGTDKIVESQDHRPMTRVDDP